MTKVKENENIGRKKGGQIGNQNARKHGFYSQVLDEKERLEYERAVKIEGLDEEIAMMRVKLHSLLEKDPDNMKLITQASNTLARLIKMKYQIDSEDEDNLIEAVKDVINNLILPLGISFGTKLFE